MVQSLKLTCMRCGNIYLGDSATACPVCYPPDESGKGQTAPIEKSTNLVKYPSNVLEVFGAGCLMDFRMKLAVELLKSPMFQFTGFSADRGFTTRDFAVYALNLATELVTLSEERGLIESLPTDDGDLTPELRAQAKRTASFQVLQQIEGQKFMQDEQARVVPLAPMFKPPAGNRGH